MSLFFYALQFFTIVLTQQAFDFLCSVLNAALENHQQIAITYITRFRPAVPQVFRQLAHRLQVPQYII